MPTLPPLVQRAKALAAGLGFESSCTDDVGTVLRLLAASAASRRIGEIGTGCGVGTAWLASGMRPEATITTIDLNHGQSAAAMALFSDLGRVRVITGDWHDILPKGPFDLLFVDVRFAKQDEPARVVDSLAVGGIAILDDLTPVELWNDEQQQAWADGDPVRRYWLYDKRLIATELRVTADSSIVLAIRSN